MSLLELGRVPEKSVPLPASVSDDKTLRVARVSAGFQCSHQPVIQFAVDRKACPPVQSPGNELSVEKKT